MISAMRTASIQLALVIVLGAVRDAGAYAQEQRVSKNCSIEIGEYRLGFVEWVSHYGNIRSSPDWTEMYLGPLGEHEVPFTATQGLVGFCIFVAGLIALPVAFTFRWKKKRAT
jgi:hypothetical protein